MGELGAGKSGDLASLSEGSLSVAEEAAQQVVNSVRPTLDSEEKRRDIIDYLQRLIRSHLNCEVFPYGSVPLKTYLPDGDIDLTAFGGLDTDKALALDVLAVLQKEEKNVNAEYEVKDTHFIDAEVKLVKCLVRNIVIDISFNQLGGLATLSFLEQVDRLVGRNHLFKRSIILVKTWCYYESRILGAHHGLISTYALETLVLYIFHLFNSSLDNPLAVLYKFLDYYSQFDWDNYCISLKGPVFKSSLPDIVVRTPESGWDNLMISEEFLENCMVMFSFGPRMVEGKSKAFQAKHLNIIDPLKENNNLGRSVNMGNFYRIRSAFKYGARKLGQILLQPRDEVSDEFNKFFANTIARHKIDNKSCIQHLNMELGDNESLCPSVSSPLEFFPEDDVLLKSSVSSDVDLELDTLGSEAKYDMDRDWTKELNLEQAPEDNSEEVIAARRLIKGSADGILDGKPGKYDRTFPSWDPSFCSPKLSAQIGSLDTGYFHQNKLADLSSSFGSLSFDGKGYMDVEVNNKYHWCMQNSQPISNGNLGYFIANANFSNLEFGEVDLKSTGGESESFNPLADLGGDYDSHIRSLLYGQICLGYSICTLAEHHPPSFSSRFQSQSKNPSCCVTSRWIPFRKRELSLKKTGYLVADSASVRADLHSEWTGKTSKRGSSFLHSNSFYGETPSHGWSGNKTKGCRYQSNRYPNRHGLYPVLDEQNYHQDRNYVVRHVRSRSSGWNKSDCTQSPWSDDHGNETRGSLSGSQKIEFGSIGNLAEEFSSATPDVRCSSPSIQEFQDKAAATKQESVAVRLIHLKNDAEFPPLPQ